MAKPRRNRAAYNAYMREYLREYYKQHPDQRKKHIRQQAIKLLEKTGYIVIKPEEGEKPNE